MPRVFPNSFRTSTIRVFRTQRFGREARPVPANVVRDTERFNKLFGSSLNAHRTSLGLSPVIDVRRHIFADQPLLAADAMLAPWPAIR